VRAELQAWTKLKWRDVMSHPHGMVLGPRQFGHFKDALRTDDKMVHAAPSEFIARACELLAGPHPVAPDGYPFQLSNRRNRHAMNSWLNELPGLHPVGKRNDVVIHPRRRGGPRHQRRRSGAGVLPRRRDRTRRVGQRPAATGRRRRRPRLGLTDLRPERRRVSAVVWRQAQPARRWRAVDPLSQTSALSSAYVGVERV